jgi:AcrR family transcriptional regulator
MTRADDTRAKLYDAALELMAEKGFTGTTVDDVVARAGVAKGTVYYHFAGKAELVEALIADRLSPLRDHFRAALSAPGPASAKLDALVRAELSWIRDNRAFAKLVMTEIWREDRLWHDALMLLRREIVGSIRDAITAGIAEGAFRDDLDADFAASALFGMTATSALDWLVFDPERPMDEVAAQILALSAHAVRR